MSLTGNVALDFIIGIILSVVITVGGTIAIFFVIAFIHAKMEEIFNG